MRAICLPCVGCGAHCDHQKADEPCWGQVLFDPARSALCNLEIHECEGHEGGQYKKCEEVK